MRKVNYLRLHSHIFLAGHGGDLGDTFRLSDKLGNKEATSMLLSDTGAVITLGSGVEIFIPSANIQVAMFVPEEPAKTVVPTPPAGAKPLGKK